MNWTINIVLCVLGLSLNDVSCIGGTNLYYGERSTSNIVENKPISVTPSGTTCTDHTLYYEPMMDQYQEDEYELEPIECSPDVCPKRHPSKHATLQLVGSSSMEIGYPGCTDVPPLLRASSGSSSGDVSSTAPWSTTTSSLGTGISNPRVRRLANTASLCGIQADFNYEFNQSETYTMWIRPDVRHTRGTIISAASQTYGLNEGYHLTLANNTLTISAMYNTRSYYRRRIEYGKWTHIALQASTTGFESSLTVFVNGEILRDSVILGQPSRRRRDVTSRHDQDLRKRRQKRSIALGDGSISNPLFLGLSGRPYFEGHDCKVSAVEECQAAGHSSFIVVPSKTTIDIMEEIVRSEINKYKKICPLFSWLRDRFLCSALLPACSIRGNQVMPCRSLCIAFFEICPHGSWNCSQYRTRNCVSNSSIPEYGSFIGSIKEATLHQGPLTAREIVELYNGTLPEVTPKNSCLCPYPGITLANPLVCAPANAQAIRYQAPIYRLGESHQVPEAINDKIPTGQYISSTNWYSTDNIDSAVITIELGERYLVYNLTYRLPSSKEGLFADTTTVQLRDADTGTWKTIGYLGFNRSCLSLSPILETTDYLTLTQPSCADVYQTSEQVELQFIYGRSGVRNRGLTIHPIIQYFLSGSAIRLILDDHMMESNSFYGIADVRIHGWRVEDNGCDCYGSGSYCADQERGRCVCRPDAGDPAVTGYTCYPYVRNEPATDAAVLPTYGPESGGTVVFIFGGFFGTVNDTVTLLVGTEACKITDRTEQRIQCITGNATGVFPLNTPLPITLTLNGGATSSVSMILDETFTYKEDPIIESITPLKTFLKGGIRQTVIGQYLDSVFAPLMNVTLVYTKDDVTTLFPQNKPSYCDVINGTHMLCPAPDIYSVPEELRHLLLDTEEEAPSRRRRGTDFATDDHAADTQRYKREVEYGLINKENLEFYIGLRLDGVTKYHNLKETKPEYGRLRVFENPTIHPWDRDGDLVRPFRAYEGDKTITIKGFNMLYGCTKADYEVTIASEICTVHDVHSAQLFCLPPSSKPELGYLHQDGAPPVQVSVGNIKQLVGYLRYEDSVWDNPTIRSAIIACIVIFILILVVIILTVVCIKKRRRIKAEKQRQATMNTYTNPTNLWDTLPSETKAELEPCMKKSESLKLGRKLGEGNFGTVHIGRFDEEKKNTILVAAKTVKDKGLGRDELIEFLEEATLMKDFHHENVLHLVGVVLQEGRPYVLLPLMEHGDLRSYLLDPNRNFTVADLLEFALQIASGMKYLSSLKFVHRDLAARNCMVDKDQKVKVADFGLARDIYSNEYYRVENKSRPLPIKWMAPEALDDHKFTTKSDVWSYGVVVWELLTRGKRPYAHVNNFELKTYLKRGNRLEKPDVSPEEIHEMISQCWNMNPVSRPSFTNIVHELESVLKSDDDDTTTTMTEGSPDDVRYQHLSRYVDYGTDRQGYETMHETQGYLDMQGHVDYIQAAKELGVAVDDSGYLAPIESRASSSRSRDRPIPAPRGRPGKAGVIGYDNVAAIQDQMRTEMHDDVTGGQSSQTPKSTGAQRNARPENIELVEVAAPEADNISGVPIYQNAHIAENTPQYMHMA